MGAEVGAGVGTIMVVCTVTVFVMGAAAVVALVTAVVVVAVVTVVVVVVVVIVVVVEVIVAIVVVAAIVVVVVVTVVVVVVEVIVVTMVVVVVVDVVVRHVSHASSKTLRMEIVVVRAPSLSDARVSSHLSFKASKSVPTTAGSVNFEMLWHVSEQSCVVTTTLKTPFSSTRSSSPNLQSSRYKERRGVYDSSISVMACLHSCRTSQQSDGTIFACSSTQSPLTFSSAMAGQDVLRLRSYPVAMAFLAIRRLLHTCSHATRRDANNVPEHAMVSGLGTKTSVHGCTSAPVWI